VGMGLGPKRALFTEAGERSPRGVCNRLEPASVESACEVQKKKKPMSRDKYLCRNKSVDLASSGNVLIQHGCTEGKERDPLVLLFYSLLTLRGWR